MSSTVAPASSRTLRPATATAGAVSNVPRLRDEIVVVGVGPCMQEYPAVVGHPEGAGTAHRAQQQRGAPGRRRCSSSAASGTGSRSSGSRGRACGSLPRLALRGPRRTGWSRPRRRSGPTTPRCDEMLTGRLTGPGPDGGLEHGVDLHRHHHPGGLLVGMAHRHLVADDHVRPGVVGELLPIEVDVVAAEPSCGFASTHRRRAGPGPGRPAGSPPRSRSRASGVRSRPRWCTRIVPPRRRAGRPRAGPGPGSATRATGRRGPSRAKGTPGELGVGRGPPPRPGP